MTMTAEMWCVLMLIYCGCGLAYIIGALLIGIPNRHDPPVFSSWPKPPARRQATSECQECGAQQFDDESRVHFYDCTAVGGPGAKRRGLPSSK